MNERDIAFNHAVSDSQFNEITRHTKAIPTIDDFRLMNPCECMSPVGICSISEKPCDNVGNCVDHEEKK
jgi:hypothetical protein